MSNKTNSNETTDFETNPIDAANEQLEEAVQQHLAETTFTDMIDAAFDRELYSPYELAKAANAFLKELGILHEFGTDEQPGLRPQMFYNYVGQGMIKATGSKGDKGRKVLKADAQAWAQKYFAKNVLPKLQELAQ